MTAGEGIYREAGLMNTDDDIYRPAGLGGEGWWDDAVSEVKKVATRRPWLGERVETLRPRWKGPSTTSRGGQ